MGGEDAGAGEATQSPPQASETPAAESSNDASAPPPQPIDLRNRAPVERPLRNAVITYFPMFIATLSLILSIYQGYLFHASIGLMEKNVARGEYIRTCREIIESYFLVKQKVGVLMPAADRSNIVGASRVTENNRLEAQAAVARFGGLGTYLANFQDEATRARYTNLTRTLTSIVENAKNTQLSDIDKLFEPADKIFATMNDDCVKLSRAMRM